MNVGSDRTWKDLELWPASNRERSVIVRVHSDFKPYSEATRGQSRVIRANHRAVKSYKGPTGEVRPVMYLFAHELMSVVPRGMDGHEFFNRFIFNAMTTLDGSPWNSRERKLLLGDHAFSLEWSERSFRGYPDLVVYHRLWMTVHV